MEEGLIEEEEQEEKKVEVKLGKVSKDGQLKLEFNQDLMIPDFI